MRIIEENYIETAQELRDFVWGGAKSTVEYLTDEELEQILTIFEDAYYGEDVTDTTLNDFIWFDDETIAEWLGYDSFDEIMERENTEE